MNASGDLEVLLRQLAEAFRRKEAEHLQLIEDSEEDSAGALYRTLIEQIPAVVFVADLRHGVGRVSVPSQIEEALGLPQAECRDPVFWYRHIHPDDKRRWSAETAEMLLKGKPLRSRFRILGRRDRVVWFQCEARLVRRPGGEPWFVHGAAVDVTELKDAEAALKRERNMASGILDAIGSLVIVVDPRMRVVRINAACERMSGFSFEDVRSRFLWDLIPKPVSAKPFKRAMQQLRNGSSFAEFETGWGRAAGEVRVVSWSITALRDGAGEPQCYVAAGSDVTIRKRLEAALLEASSREKERIGRDLHDGLGQLLTGIGFMCKALENRLAKREMAETADAAKVGRLVSDAIRKTRELSRGLMPIAPGPGGLARSLQQLAQDTADLFGVECSFRCSPPPLVLDPEAAAHLYHIAQEAAHNGIKHGRAGRVEIILSSGNGQRALTIHDSGQGMSKMQTRTSGMGLDIMEYRAQVIGGSLEISSLPGQGTTVVCRFPTE